MNERPLTLARLNAASHKDFVDLLAGIYEHSPWVVERAWPRGPFVTLAQLKRTLVEVVSEADRDEQLRLAARPPRARRQGDGHRDDDRASRATSRAGSASPRARRTSWRRSRA